MAVPASVHMAWWRATSAHQVRTRRSRESLKSIDGASAEKLRSTVRENAAQARVATTHQTINNGGAWKQEGLTCEKPQANHRNTSSTQCHTSVSDITGAMNEYNLTSSISRMSNHNTLTNGSCVWNEQQPRSLDRGRPVGYAPLGALF